MPVDSAAHTVLIVNLAENPETRKALRAWLESEKRLGLGVYGCATVEAARSDSAAAPRPAAGGRTATAPHHPGESPRSAGPSAPPDRPTFSARPAPTPPAPRAAASAPPLIPGASGAPLAIAETLAAGRSLPPLNDKELSRDEAADALARLHDAYVRQCNVCRLHEQRIQPVFGVGHPRAELMFVGEGPGADEDAKGEPFVGRAGELLTKMIAAMTLTREQVYIANVVKCRPPGNRTPQEDEIAACSPYLLRQLAIIRPKWIVALGRPATQTLLTTSAPITAMRGKWQEFPPPALAGLNALPRCRVMPTFHPAYLLRSPQEKAKAWADLQEVMAAMGLTKR